MQGVAFGGAEHDVGFGMAWGFGLGLGFKVLGRTILLGGVPHQHSLREIAKEM